MWKQLFEEAPRHAVEYVASSTATAANLLSPQRKLIYGVFAFAPGTLLALYLNSVKNRMNRENEVLRQEHISEEMKVEAADQQKDVVLMQMIDELRERIQQLEREAREDTVASKADNATIVATEDTLLPTQRLVAEKLAKMNEKAVKAVEPHKTELPSFLGEYEDTLRPWLDRFDMLATEAEKLHTKVSEIMEKREAEQKKAEEELILKKKVDEKSSQGIEQSGIRERIADRERDMIAQDIRAYKASAAAQKPQ